MTTIWADEAAAPAAPAPEAAARWADGPLGEVQQHAVAIGRRTAAQARAVAAFARDRPSSDDRQPGEPGCASSATRLARPEVLEAVSEWAAQELAVALQLTQQSAVALLTRSVTLVERLPATLTALEAGVVHAGHLWAFTERVGILSDAGVRARIEREVLAWMVGRVTTPGQLAERIRVLVLRHDAAGAAQRLADAIRTRGVTVASGRAEGLSQLTAVLTTPEARACLDALGKCADTLVDDDPPGSAGVAHRPRTRAQKMADCLVDLILRPGETDLPVVTAHLTVVASVETLAGGDQPGEVDGQVVSAEVIRHLARALGLVPGGTASSGGASAAADDGGDERDAGQQLPDSPDGPDGPDSHRDAERSGPESARTASRGPDLPPGPWTPAGEAPGEPVLDRPSDDASCPGARARAGTDRDIPPDPLLGLYGQLDAGAVSDAEWARLVAAWTDCDVSDPPFDARDGAPEPPGWPLWPHVPLRPADQTCVEAAGEPSGAAGWADDAAAGSTGGVPGWRPADAAVWAASVAVERARSEVVRARIEVRAAEFAATTVEDTYRRSPAGDLGRARDSVEALGGQRRQLQAVIGELLMRTAGGGLAERPRVAVVDALTGTLLALTDGPELRRTATCARDRCARRRAECTHELTGRPGLGSPEGTHRYRPGRALDRFVRARDRRCRFPGCRSRVPRLGELDHDRRWPEGPTSSDNLAGYCTRHHRGKHQAPGWQHVLLPDGRLVVSTPSGLSLVTDPPPFPTTRPSAPTSDDPPPF